MHDGVSGGPAAFLVANLTLAQLTPPETQPQNAKVYFQESSGIWVVTPGAKAQITLSVFNYTSPVEIRYKIDTGFPDETNFPIKTVNDGDQYTAPFRFVMNTSENYTTYLVAAAFDTAADEMVAKGYGMISSRPSTGGGGNQ